jgi:glycosyltransferase involved in cell wall biosynthesis
MDLPRVLVIASDTIGDRMAGSGVRYWNLARVIGAQQGVTLATPSETGLRAPQGVAIEVYGQPGSSADERGHRLANLVANHDVIVAQHLPYLYADAAVLASKYLVVDLYAPWILEKLEYSRIDPERGEIDRKDDVAILNRLLALGDFFVCASERQRDFWLGALAVTGRLELAHAVADPQLRSLIDIASFGLPDGLPRRTGSGPRDAFAAIGPEDRVLLWNGGVWNWLDPLTAIRAVRQVVDDMPDVRLVFMGVRSPGAQVAEMNIVESARTLANDLGLLDRHVFFNDWVPYEERQNWLLEADASISLHTETVEARYSFRTRMLDNIWCGLPCIVTRGDVLADLVEQESIGETVPAGDVDAVTAGIRRAFDRDRARAMRANLASVYDRYTWEAVSAPLLAYCRTPWKLGSRAGRDSSAEYVSGLERMYVDTAEYARYLEQVIEEKNTALAARVTPERERARPDLGSLFRRVRRG